MIFLGWVLSTTSWYQLFKHFTCISYRLKVTWHDEIPWVCFLLLLCCEICHILHMHMFKEMRFLLNPHVLNREQTWNLPRLSGGRRVPAVTTAKDLRRVRVLQCLQSWNIIWDASQAEGGSLQSRHAKNLRGVRVLPCQVHAAQITTAVGSTTKAAMDGDWAKQLNLSHQADWHGLCMDCADDCKWYCKWLERTRTEKHSMVWKLRGQAPNAQVDHLSNAQSQSISVDHGGHETHWNPTHHESQRPPSGTFGYFQQIPSGYDIHSLPWKITMLLRTVNHHKPSISIYLYGPSIPWRTVSHTQMVSKTEVLWVWCSRPKLTAAPMWRRTIRPSETIADTELDAADCHLDCPVEIPNLVMINRHSHGIDGP